MADELGDLLFAVTNIGRHVRADPEQALRGTNTKFRNRFRYIETELARSGETLQAATLERMEELWQAAKAIERAVGTGVGTGAGEGAGTDRSAETDGDLVHP